MFQLDDNVSIPLLKGVLSRGLLRDGGLCHSAFSPRRGQTVPAFCKNA